MLNNLLYRLLILTIWLFGFCRVECTSWIFGDDTSEQLSIRVYSRDITSPCPPDIAAAIKNGELVTIDLLKAAEADVRKLPPSCIIYRIACKSNQQKDELDFGPQAVRNAELENLEISVYEPNDPRSKSPLYRYLILKRYVELFGLAKRSVFDITSEHPWFQYSKQLSLAQAEIFRMSIAKENQVVQASTEEEEQYLRQFVQSATRCTACVPTETVENAFRSEMTMPVKAWMLARHIVLSADSMRVPFNSMRLPEGDSIYSTVYRQLLAGKTENDIMNETFATVCAEQVVSLANNIYRIYDLRSFIGHNVLHADDVLRDKLDKKIGALEVFWDARASINKARNESWNRSRYYERNQLRLRDNVSNCASKIESLDKNDAHIFLLNVLKDELGSFFGEQAYWMNSRAQIDEFSPARRTLFELANHYAPARDYVGALLSEPNSKEEIYQCMSIRTIAKALYIKISRIRVAIRTHDVEEYSKFQFDQLSALLYRLIELDGPDHFLDLWQSLQSFIKHCSSHDVLNFCASYVDTHYIRTLGKILNKVKSILRLDDDKYTES